MTGTPCPYRPGPMGTLVLGVTVLILLGICLYAVSFPPED